MSSILAFISWYIIITLLGWLIFPLAYFLFPALADRGYSLSRVAGLLTWSYLFWIFTSLGFTQNTIGGILFALCVLIGLSAWALSNIEDRILSILGWLRINLRYIVTVEILFLLSFVFLAFLRAGNPELDGTERPMELMFINSILRSPTFPPHELMAFRLCHLLLLLRLCDDRHARETCRTHRQCGAQLDDLAHLCAGRDWRVWDFI